MYDSLDYAGDECENNDCFGTLNDDPISLQDLETVRILILVNDGIVYNSGEE